MNVGEVSVARKDAASFFRGTVEEPQGFPAVAAENERVDTPRVSITKHRPESHPTGAIESGTADKRQSIVPLRLEDGEALTGCNSDVSFEHALSVARLTGAVQRSSADGASVGGSLRGRLRHCLCPRQATRLDMPMSGKKLLHLPLHLNWTPGRTPREGGATG